ncbi:hypothetical protein [Glaciibacter flavus]|uniref:hypothetical protein n=1 Tax=Orlajensenia flava TaxID=2565934 RepID=UPI003B00945E
MSAMQRSPRPSSMHPPENIERMAAGIPLTDAARPPWPRRIADWIRARLEVCASR